MSKQEQVEIIRSEIEQAGFIAYAVGNYVGATLANRKPSFMEVEAALRDTAALVKRSSTCLGGVMFEVV